MPDDMTLSEAQELISTALAERAERFRRLAVMQGPRHGAPRYEEARRCEVLASAILAADPLELDAVIDQR